MQGQTAAHGEGSTHAIEMADRRAKTLGDRTLLLYLRRDFVLVTLLVGAGTTICGASTATSVNMILHKK